MKYLPQDTRLHSVCFTWGTLYITLDQCLYILCSLLRNTKYHKTCIASIVCWGAHVLIFWGLSYNKNANYMLQGPTSQPRARHNSAWCVHVQDKYHVYKHISSYDTRLRFVNCLLPAHYYYLFIVLLTSNELNFSANFCDETFGFLVLRIHTHYKHVIDSGCITFYMTERLARLEGW